MMKMSIKIREGNPGFLMNTGEEALSPRMAKANKLSRKTQEASEEHEHGAGGRHVQKKWILSPGAKTEQ